MKKDKVEEELAEKLHIWYLKATSELSLESYNPKAQKPFSELTDEQQFIDLYIAQKIRDSLVINEDEVEKITRDYINTCVAPNYPVVKELAKAISNADIIKVKP
jgi:hypothetical protein